MAYSKKENDILHVPLREKIRVYKTFLGIIWRAHPLLACLRIGFLIISGLSQPLSVYAFSLLIHAITVQDFSRIGFLLGTVIVVNGLRIFATNVANSKLDDWFTRNVSLSCQELVFEHLARLDPEELLQEKTKRHLDFVREDMWRLNSLPGHTERFFRSAIMLIGAFGLAFSAPWWVTALVVISAALEAVTLGQEAKRDLWDITWNSLDGRRVEYTRYVFLSGEEFRELRLLDAAQRFNAKLKAAAKRILSRFREAALRSVRNRVLLSCFNIAAYGAVVFILGSQAIDAPEKLGLLYVAIQLFGLMGEALGGMSSAAGSLFTDLGVLSCIENLLSLPLESEAGHRIPKTPLTIEFRHVSFCYPHSSKAALDRVSVVFREGEHLAIVGENGAGKSTFLRLLSGLDQPTSGSILLNGKPLSSYNKQEWRRAFHLMLQGAKIYQDFIRDNLLYGQPEKRGRSPVFSLEEGTRIAGADTVIQSAPAGYDTFLGDWAAPPDISAHRLSGGQEQRLLIARTLIHGGRILGFDEPTSAMDAVAETAFFERLHEAMQGRGLIFISHRFSTVRRASRILVFREGKLTEDGTHEELVKKGGEYARLYEEQAKWYV